jgi:hypothetical protein
MFNRAERFLCDLGNGGVRCLKVASYSLEQQELKYQNIKVVAVFKIGSSTDFRAGINQYL